MTRKIVLATLAATAIGAAVAAQAANTALSPDANAAFLAANAHKPGVTTMRDGLQFKILKSGFGQRPGDADVVTVYYELKLINGAHVEGTEPDFPTQMPMNSLIPGWKEALKTMRVGDHWQVVVPSALGYGPAGTPDGRVPPNQTLVFDIELIKTFTPPPKPNKDDDDQNKMPATIPAAAQR
jgi:FKBP-type peptidyl-prolyl cis-trans isomerase